ncbi:MAG: gliding motility-associated C-terminal domain-containing protein, partial [Cyclobacteriaceae bacterium]|nr:gliding motility-associated C-terminal domain-containing protein [Cyclobacteriaceae bacterium]
DINKTFETKIYTYTNTKWDTLSHDINNFIAADILSIDVDKDGWQDLLIGGKTTLGETVLEFYRNNKDSLVVESHSFDYPIALKMTKADLDADGDFDLFFHGDPEQHSPISYYENTDGQFKKVDLMIEPDSVSSLFAADLNSDGSCDVALKTHSPSGDRNVVKFNDGSLNFSTEKILEASYQDFGDWDWDGDLDLVKFKTRSDSLEVFLFNNNSPSNIGPEVTGNSQVFTFNKSVLISWDSVIDDHTNQEAISYDLYIRENNIILSPGFEIDQTYRTVVEHGNQYSLTSAAYFNLELGVYEYGIETVDNAFYAGGGIGNGDICRGKFIVCGNILTYRHTVCRNEEATLVAKENKTGNWYSSLNGILATSTDSISHTITESDTIYFSINNSLDCEDQELWIFTVLDSGEVNDLPDIWACKDEVLVLDVGNFWKTVQWESSLLGSLGDESKINFVVQQADTISVTKESFQGCIFTDTFVVNISQPLISLNGDVFKLLKGESVQLIASGGETYSWFPDDHLNDSTINNPVATPEITTTYVVNATDSIGCTSSDSVLVIIETKAFIPNLFTPNRDGKNDVLKIYGLEEVAEFSFKVFNRSGSLVYESSNELEVVNTGWDGTWRGKSQPNGVYYWKVSGTYKNGDSITLNGENSGAIHLLR